MNGIVCNMERKRARRKLDDLQNNLCRIVLERQQVMAHKHIPIETWLEALGLLEYQDIFTDYRGVEDLLMMTEADIKDMGLKHSAHRAKIVSSLRILKDKYDRGYKIPRVIHRSHSASAQLSSPTSNSLPNTNNFPDYQVVNISPERLEHDLISELNSDPSELKHWPWYHGSVSRQHVVGLVKNSGDFLVRDSVSQPGDFVLTCCWRGVPLHFVINSEVKERENLTPEISYHFEDDRFCSVQDLVQFYMAHHKPVTKTSGALLLNPIARTMPLSYYDTKYGFLGNGVSAGHYTPVHSPKSSPFNSAHNSPDGSPLSQRRSNRTGSQPALSLDEGNGNSMFVPYIDRSESLPSISVPSAPSTHNKNNSEVPPMVLQHYHQRAGSEPAMNVEPSVSEPPKLNLLELPKKMNSAISDSHLDKPPPPKPSRIPSVKYIGKDRPKITVRNKELYDDEDDRDYSDYSQVKETPSWLKFNPEAQQRVQGIVNNKNKCDNIESDYDNNFNCVNIEDKRSNSDPVVNGFQRSIPNKSRKFSETRFSILDSRDYGEIPQTPVTPKATEFDSNFNESDDYVVHLRKRKISMPNFEANMSLKPSEYSSVLISNDNKPLESGVLIALKHLLLEGNIHHLAQHLTRTDLDLCKVTQENDLGMGVHSGLELVTLPHGKQLRQNIIERCYCMKVFVMVMILTCANVKERARMLSQFIQICVELRSTMGNLFGFANVMEGLTSAQVLRLRDTWLILRQNHTSSAFQFDTKLKAAYKTLNDGSGLLPLQNVSIPDVAPLVFLMERDSDTLTDFLPWEISDQNSGLEILLTHLDTARLITCQTGLYRVTAQSIMKGFTSEQQVLDMFSTEFHLRLLWGSKGAVVNRSDRQTKFEQLLSVLSDRAEPPGDDGTAL